MSSRYKFIMLACSSSLRLLLFLYNAISSSSSSNAPFPSATFVQVLSYDDHRQWRRLYDVLKMGYNHINCVAGFEDELDLLAVVEDHLVIGGELQLAHYALFSQLSKKLETCRANYEVLEFARIAKENWHHQLECCKIASLSVLGITRNRDCALKQHQLLTEECQKLQTNIIELEEQAPPDEPEAKLNS